jgi:hypothetical protein
MKQRRGNQYYGSSLSFVDMLFNIIMLFVLLFFAAVLLMNAPAKKKDIESKADMMIAMSWPDNSPHDIDLWIKVPDGTLIGYPNKENSYLHLERDDLGITNNYIPQDERNIGIAPRREVISFRGKVNGRYITNIHYYAAKNAEGRIIPKSPGKVPVVVELIQINPTYRVLSRKEIILESLKEEKTAFSFIILDNQVMEIEQDIEEPFISEYKDTGIH